jgi:hypothetical protein
MVNLAETIYEILRQRANLSEPFITYSDLANQLSSLPDGEALAPTDKILFQSLGEVGHACRNCGLPSLTALVVRKGERTPGAGYYREFHPNAGSDETKQRAAWAGELKKVRAARYPQTLAPSSG